jgi:hypothetical protein
MTTMNTYFWRKKGKGHKKKEFSLGGPSEATKEQRGVVECEDRDCALGIPLERKGVGVGAN